MSLDIYEPTDRERRIADAIRALCVSEIEQRDLVKVAASLGLMPAGVQSLLAHPKWQLETAFRVAEALDLKVVSTLEEACELVS